VNIQDVESWLGRKLPEDYRVFLLSHTEKVFGESIYLYLLGDIVERNETYETKTYCSGYLVVGDDSGGRAIVIPLQTEARRLPVFIVDHGSMMVRDFEKASDDFLEWLNMNCPLP
jgi:hypothetical protein